RGCFLHSVVMRRAIEEVDHPGFPRPRTVGIRCGRPVWEWGCWMINIDSGVKQNIDENRVDESCRNSRRVIHNAQSLRDSRNSPVAVARETGINVVERGEKVREERA